MDFPKLPIYIYSWRSIQYDPMLGTDEHITLAVIVKGKDGSLVVDRLVPELKLKQIFNAKHGRLLNNQLNICVASAKSYFSSRSLAEDWQPPLDCFLLGKTRNSVAADLPDAVVMASKNSSVLHIAHDLGAASTPDELER